jgi:predicted nuclease of restriction endonuclease-like (RecB) superfamily
MVPLRPLDAVENRAARVHYESESIRAGWSVRHLESFLLELGAGFTFVARQKRIRIGDEWYRIDLLLYHRALRCLVVVDPNSAGFRTPTPAR